MGLQGFPGGPPGGIGGFVGQQAQNIGNIKANTGALQQSAQGLTGASNQLINQAQGAANTPNLSGAGNLGAGQGLLGNALQTGLAVDVNPLVEAAQIRGQQQFQDNLRGVDERMGAMGLGASSAAEAARSRESGRMAGGIEALGLEAGVGAAQQAAQNQMSALGQVGQGVGPGLQAQQISQQGQAQGLPTFVRKILYWPIFAEQRQEMRLRRNEKKILDTRGYGSTGTQSSGALVAYIMFLLSNL